MKNEKLKTKNLKSNLKSKRVFVGMSGGVDSSVAAMLLKEQGFDVVGGFLKFWSDPKCVNKKENTCCNYESLLAARAVCDQLKIPFYVFDVSREFKKEVVDYFIKEYDSGRTPNPCVVCNKKIKFGWMLEQAKKLGCDYIATGHYARIKCSFVPSQKDPKDIPFCKTNSIQLLQKRQSRGKCALVYPEYIEGQPTFCDCTHSLYQACDKKKDQSYFLWQLDQNQLAHILFPIGYYTKEEVRKMAKKWKLPTAQKKESQDLCFISTDNADFLANYADKLTKPGDIVDLQGNVLGKHKGLCYYTVGQREGLGVQLKFPISNFQFPNKFEIRNPKSETKSNSKKLQATSYKLISGLQPVYVLRLNVDKNQLVVGSKEDLYSYSLEAEKVSWIGSCNMQHVTPVVKQSSLRGAACNKEFKYQVKIRYGAKSAECKVHGANGNTIKVIFKEPQRAITPGQSIVFYDREEVVGGGIIK